MTSETQDFPALKQALAEILGNIHTLSNCQSVGIRLHKNGDYPYYVHKGFPDFFILKENSLCTQDNEGNPILNKENNSLLECMCGNVLKGRVESKRPYFTKNGSFWTNSTTQLLETTTHKEIMGRTRNMCHHSGYESVALIPMRAGNRTLGLIQLNDPRENMFTPKAIEKYEAIANHAGTVVRNAFEIQERMYAILDLVNGTKNSED